MLYLKVQIIPIATKEYPADTPALITGWGRVIYQSSFHPKTMQMATTNLVSDDVCRKYWGLRITNRMQCVGGNGMNSACKVNTTVWSKQSKTVYSFCCTWLCKHLHFNKDRRIYKFYISIKTTEFIKQSLFRFFTLPHYVINA